MSVKNKGIDLGTTNSEIAELRGTGTYVFPNARRLEYTPSAVYLNRAEHLVIGEEAKNRYESEPENAFIEFKRAMGSNTVYTFARNSRKMKPEELSAEVLKSLCGDAQRETGEVVTAAVITVPADFNLNQCKATKQAATLAGIKHSMTLQEPIAAAQAYSFDSEENRTFWLVYDFGGGTLDAAIIQVRDGSIDVTGHLGDNELGGKNIDWALVEDLLIPALLKERALTDFQRGNIKWRGAMAKLKIAAENAKIRLSAPNTFSTELHFDFLCNDDHQEPVEFDYVLTRESLNCAASPFIRKSINICKEVLRSRGLEPQHIGKLILVGGPTMMPLLRDMLADPNEGLGATLAAGVDPLTVVARGAAIFAATQKLAPETSVPVPVGQFGLKLDYPAVCPDTDPEVVGTVLAGENQSIDFTGYTIEFFNPGLRPPWRSGKKALGAKGKFLVKLRAEKNQENKFEIELCAPSGVAQIVSPGFLAITVKGAGIVAAPPLTHALGIELANGQVRRFFEKGTPLPARRKHELRTVSYVKKGADGHVLRVPSVEGENWRAARNRRVGTLRIPGDKIKNDIPGGARIEISISIDSSSMVQMEARLPDYEEVFADVLHLESINPTPQELAAELKSTRERLSRVSEKADKVNDSAALEFCHQITQENLVAEADKAANAALADDDAARQCHRALNRLNTYLDQAEEALEWPSLVLEAKRQIERGHELLSEEEFVKDGDRETFAILEKETLAALDSKMPDLLERKIDGIRGVLGPIVRRDPAVWAHWFQEAKDDAGKMQNPAAAQALYAKGEEAISNRDKTGLTEAVRGLWRLLPASSRPEAASDVL